MRGGGEMTEAMCGGGWRGVLELSIIAIGVCCQLTKHERICDHAGRSPA